MSLSPEELSAVRAQAGRIGAHTQWSRETDPAGRTATARKAFLDQFERQARELHPTGSPETIARAAEHLRKAYFARLALASANARSRRKREGGGDAP